MAILPTTTSVQRAVAVPTNLEPSLTYEFDFNIGDFTGRKIDEDQALNQFIRKALLTKRFKHMIYDADYGSEIYTLIGSDVTSDLLETEVGRMLREALLYDDRIEDIKDLSVTRDPSTDKAFVSFTILKRDGSEIPVEEEVYT